MAGLGKGYGFHRNIADDTIEIMAAHSIVLGAGATSVTIGAGATSGLTVVAGGHTITAGGLAITAGGLDIVSPLTLFGYATGAGGADTQTGNKQTTVEINNVCGTVTTHNQELAAGAETTFQVDCDPVGVGDVVICSIQDGGTPEEYVAWCSLVAAASFKITIANQSGVAASDVIKINFAIISAVAA